MGIQRVGDLCFPCSNALAVREDDDVEAAVRRFASEPETHTLFVVDGKGRLKGLVKTKHILNWVRLKVGAGQKHHFLTRAVESFDAFEFIKLAQSTRIGEISSPAVSVKPTDTLDYALNLMADKEVVELPVVTDSGELVGEITLTRVLDNMLDGGGGTKGK